jgi:hypothetical protein
MQNKTKIATKILVLLIIVFIFLSNQGGAELDKIIRNAIMVAYMNGYADALQLKVDEINKLKTNEKFLRQRIEQAAAEYIIAVDDMNR